MGKFKTSLDLFKRSLSVVGQNKSLLLFPLIELVFICLIVSFFFVPFVLSNTGHALTESAHWAALADRFKIFAQDKHPILMIILIAIYLISIFSATFINVAFYNEILQALNGNRVSISRGIGVARSKIKLILLWSLFAGLVGIIIKSIESRLSFVGQWIVRLIGITWSVASIFVIPVIVREERNTNPLKVLKTSATMLKKTWGESLIGFLGINIGIAYLISIFLLVLFLSVFIGQASFWAFIITVSLDVICLLV